MPNRLLDRIARKLADIYRPVDYDQRRRCRYCQHARQEHDTLPYVKDAPTPNRPPFMPMVSPGQRSTNYARCSHKNSMGDYCQCMEYIE